MLLVLLAAAALAAAEPAPAATGETEVSPVTVPAPARADDKAKPKQICFSERPTGSRRIQRVCYDRDVYDQTRERLSRQHVRESPTIVGGGVGVR
jgi:hypothetical protein